MNSNYYSLIKKYTFKCLLECIINYGPSYPENDWEVEYHGVFFSDTDKHPVNDITTLGIIQDSIKNSPNKNGRKTITKDEFKNICIVRNKQIPIDSGTYKREELLGSIFSIAKNQSFTKADESLSPDFLRDYYIFTIIDSKFKNDPKYYLESRVFFEKLFKNDMLFGVVMTLLFYTECHSTNKRIMKKPFTKYESFFLETFGDYAVYHHGSNNTYVPYKHCVIDIGGTNYIPFQGQLFSRLSHILYWRIKDYYLDNKQGNFFPNNFGLYFEEYIDDYLGHVIGNNYVRIDKNTSDDEGIKKPDFEFDKHGFKFIVECKSRLISLSDTNNKLYSGNFRDDIVDGIKQLKSYKLEEKNAIRLLLLYENDFPLIDLFEQEMRKETEMDEYFWIVTIDEFESFVETNDSKDFTSVVNYKITKNKTDKPVSLGKAMEINNVGKHYSTYILNHVHNLVDKKATEIIDYFNKLN